MSKVSDIPAPPDSVIRAHFTKPCHRFFNRELSWLAFNTRVLEEAMNPNLPLLERVKFISISANNLDEFYMVRVAGLKDNEDQGITTTSADGLTPRQQLERIHEAASTLMRQQQQAWIVLQRELEREEIRVITPADLSAEDRVWLREYFESNIFPILTPIAVDPAHPFPFVPNLGIVQLYELQPPKKRKRMLAMVQFPVTQSRFVKLEVGHGHRFMLLGDVIECFIDLLFPGYTLLNSGVFRIVRDSDVEVEEEAEDLMRYLDKAVKQRRYGRIVRLKASKSASPELVRFMCEHLPAARRDVIEVEGMVGLSQLAEIYPPPRPEIHAVQSPLPRAHQRFRGRLFCRH
jgi:polyphosphate kinase